MGLIKLLDTNCDNPNRLGDIVYIHGLTGHPVKTWHPLEKEDKDCWPYWLGEERPDLGIWSFGYEAAASAWLGNAMSMFDQGKNLLDELKINNLDQKPLIFITHSLGGLVFKKMLRYGQDYPRDLRIKAILQQTKGIVFIATPHTGSDLPTNNLLIRILRTVGQENVNVRELEPHSSQLRELDNWYRQNDDTNNIQMKVFYETKKTFYNKISLNIVVDADSANPKIRDVECIPVEKDHITIAKPLNKNDKVYKGVKQFIEDIIPITKPLALRPSQTNQLDFSQLETYLNHEEWQKADEETAKLLSQSVSYTDVEWLTETDIQKIPCQVLKKIDELWAGIDRHLGFRVQNKIYKSLEQKYPNDPETLWIEFGNYVCWRKNGQWLDYSSIFSNSMTHEFFSNGYLPRLMGIIIGMKDFFSRCDKCLLK